MPQCIFTGKESFSRFTDWGQLTRSQSRTRRLHLLRTSEKDYPCHSHCRKTSESWTLGSQSHNSEGSLLTLELHTYCKPLGKENQGSSSQKKIISLKCTVFAKIMDQDFCTMMQLLFFHFFFASLMPLWTIEVKWGSVMCTHGVNFHLWNLLQPDLRVHNLMLWQMKMRNCNGTYVAS